MAKETEVRYVVGDQLRVNRYSEVGDGGQTLLSVTTVEPDESIVVRYFGPEGDVTRTIH